MNGTNYTIAEIGSIDTWQDLKLERQGRVVSKQFLKELLQATGCEISINSMPPGDGVHFYHQHKENEEIFFFIRGQGQMQIDGEIVEVRDGSVIRIAPNGLRTWRNTSPTEPLICLVIQVREGSLRQWTSNDGIKSPLPVTWPS